MAMTTKHTGPHDERHDEPGDIIADLSEYLDRGENPPQDMLDRSPAYGIALEALLRFRSVARSLLQADADAEPARDDSWVSRILTNIHIEARAGRSIPLTAPTPAAELSITEGAVRGLIRAAGDAVPGALVGRCRLDGDVTVPGSPITVAVEADVYWGEPLPDAAQRIREDIARALRRHTELTLAAIDVTITDVHIRPDGEEPGR
jgi:uncharacterized alkaline shock family protein YloU